MKKGRRPKPVELKRLAGNPGKRKLPETVKLSVIDDLTEPPDYLNDPIAEEIW